MNEEEMLSLNNYLEALYQAMQIGDIVYEPKHSSELYNLINKLLKENQKYKEVINKLKQFCNNDDNFWILDAYSQDDVYEIQEKLLDMLNEVEDDGQ